MLCQEIECELDAYLGGELGADAAEEIEAHLLECENCRTAMEVLRKENALYREYASRIDVPADAQGGQVHRAVPRIYTSRWWKWAAAAVLLVGVALLWRFYAGRAAPEYAGAPPPDAASTPMIQAAQVYDGALVQLKAAYSAKKADLDPGVVEEFDRNLEIAQTAVEECRRALKENPDSQQVIALLLHGYQMQAGMLRQITEAL